MRLTSDILLRADNYLNPMKEREIHLRGFKIPAIENIAVLQDQFDSIDLSDNEIRKIENFPRMSRLTTLILNNNYISKIDGEVGSRLISLKVLILTNNRLESLSELDSLATLANTLEFLSILDNPVTQRENYRLYVIHRFPLLKSLDFRKVTKSERQTALKFFKSKDGKDYISSVEAESSSSSDQKTAPAALTFTTAQKDYIRTAIENASSLQEIERIEKQFKAGTFIFPAEISGNSSDPTPSSAAASTASVPIEEES